MLYGIGLHELAHVKAEVWPWLEKSAARTRGKYTVDDIWAGIESAHAQLWIWKTPTAFGVIVTQICQYPANRCLVVKIGTGYKAREWAMPTLARLEEFGRASGCTGMEILARPGWERLIGGYDKTHVILEKTL